MSLISGHSGNEWPSVPTHSHFTEFCKSGDMETHSGHPIKSEYTMYNFLCIHPTDLIPTCDGWFLVYQINISNTILVSVQFEARAFEE